MANLHISETRAEAVAKELLHIRGWKVQRPPKGNLLWKNEYRDYPHLVEVFQGQSKTGTGNGYPDFLIVDRTTIRPLIVGETKAQDRDINLAIKEACNNYGEAFIDRGLNVLAAGVAGDEHSNIAVQIKKRARNAWLPIEYHKEPIQWIPSPQETEVLITDLKLFELQPKVPSNEVLAQRGDEINRILRECKIKDEFRPAIMGAFMLGLWNSKGEIRIDPDHILEDINNECRKAFRRAGKSDIAESIYVPEANRTLAAKAFRIVHILRLLNITTLTAEHDYLGQLYEMFFRFTGGNTIGQFFTPRHITQFIVNIAEISKRDIVVDPTCGTGGFLVSSLSRMTEGKPLTRDQINKVVNNHLIGFEDEPITAALCVANMILRGDGTTGVVKGDCFTDPKYPEGEATVVVGNPPFPHRKTDEPAERFVNRGLEALQTRGNLFMIVPASLLASSNKRKWRQQILKENSLLGVFTLPSELFQPYATSTTAIICLKRGVPHSKNIQTFFCRVVNDGFKLRKGTRVEQSGGQLKKALEEFNKGGSIPGFCKTITISDTDKEWAPGAYIEFVDHPEQTIINEVHQLIRNLTAFYATFAPKILKLKKLIESREINPIDYKDVVKKKSKQLNGNCIASLFDIYYGEQGLESKDHLNEGFIPVISSQGSDNGCYGFYEFAETIAHVLKPPFVTIPRTGSIGEAFVQELPCGVSSDCLLLIPKEGTDLNDLFIAASIIRLEKWRFDYSRKITPGRIESIQIPRNKSLKTWIEKNRIAANDLSVKIIETLNYPPKALRLQPLEQKQLEQAFNQLAENWRNETGMLSVVQQKIIHPAYQRIIGLGEPVLPFIFRELRSKHEHWLWALRAITGKDPANTEDNFSQAVSAWLNWGKEQGYL